MNEFKTQFRYPNHSLKTYMKDKSFYGLMPFARRVYRKVQYARHALSDTLYRAQYRTISKKQFINDLKTAIGDNIGYAAAKIGKTAQYMMYHEILLKKETNNAKIKDFQSGLEFQCLKQQGIFPVDNNFYLRYSQFYTEHVKNIDCLGICYTHGFSYEGRQRELEIIKYHRLQNKLIIYWEQEPDRSSPTNEKNCYLQYFKNKKILIICPFAEILKERATKEVFEGVWSKTGKKWFYPKKVEALEFPYGFSIETHKRYPTVIDLLKHITAEINGKDFDIALIAAAGLAIPIASYVKNMGKIGIDLGGHLQALFGVKGQRWRVRDDFKTLYFNNWWIDMPAKYRPKEVDVCDKGAYW